MTLAVLICISALLFVACTFFLGYNRIYKNTDGMFGGFAIMGIALVYCLFWVIPALVFALFLKG